MITAAKGMPYDGKVVFAVRELLLDESGGHIHTKHSFVILSHRRAAESVGAAANPR